jgi:hypothetical protein
LENYQRHGFLNASSMCQLAKRSFHIVGMWVPVSNPPSENFHFIKKPDTNISKTTKNWQIIWHIVWFLVVADKSVLGLPKFSVAGATTVFLEGHCLRILNCLQTRVSKIKIYQKMNPFNVIKHRRGRNTSQRGRGSQRDRSPMAGCSGEGKWSDEESVSDEEQSRGRELSDVGEPDGENDVPDII